MRKTIFFAFLFSLFTFKAQSQEVSSPAEWPDSIYSGKQGGLHVQGVAVDEKNGHVYFSFTDKLIKMDTSGRLIGSLIGFVGHLGDLDFNMDDGKIYGSLEYKNDAIGKGINKELGIKSNRNQNGFYIAIVDGSKIVRPNMNAENEDLLRTVYLPEVLNDYEAEVNVDGKVIPHRFACSGIDGVAFAPAMGSSNMNKKYLYVAYGIYGDTTRNDNDHQILLRYDVSKWDRYAKHLSQDKLHRSGPGKPLDKYFIKTGNSRYGIQNLAYDSFSGHLFAAVYRGSKTEFPNYDLFVIDGKKKPVKGQMISENKKINISSLSLLDAGLTDPETGIRGWYFKWGATGLCPLGDGLFYISHNGKSDDGQQQSTIYKYKWIGDTQNSFIRVN